jgi:hypothetical protein
MTGVGRLPADGWDNDGGLKMRELSSTRRVLFLNIQLLVNKNGAICQQGTRLLIP